jgi:hypothetical protein
MSTLASNVQIGDHGAAAPRKQDHLPALVGGWIDFALNRMGGNVEEATRPDRDDILSAGTSFEASCPRHHVPVHVVVTVMVPAGSRTWLDS